MSLLIVVMDINRFVVSVVRECFVIFYFNFFVEFII